MTGITADGSRCDAMRYGVARPMRAMATHSLQHAHGLVPRSRRRGRAGPGIGRRTAPVPEDRLPRPDRSCSLACGGGEPTRVGRRRVVDGVREFQGSALVVAFLDTSLSSSPCVRRMTCFCFRTIAPLSHRELRIIMLRLLHLVMRLITTLMQPIILI